MASPSPPFNGYAVLTHCRGGPRQAKCHMPNAPRDTQQSHIGLQIECFVSLHHTSKPSHPILWPKRRTKWCLSWVRSLCMKKNHSFLFYCTTAFVHAVHWETWHLDVQVLLTELVFLPCFCPTDSPVLPIAPNLAQLGSLISLGISVSSKDRGKPESLLTLALHLPCNIVSCNIPSICRES